MKVTLEDRVVRLRHAFDESFGVPAAPQEELVDFLLVQVATSRFALRLSEISGVVKGQAVVRIPTRRRELLGLSCVRGAVLSVYSMATILGLPETASSTSWLALSERPDPVAVAFLALDGFVRVPRSSAPQAPGSEGLPRLTLGVLNVEATACPIVDLRRMFDGIRRPAESAGRTRSGL